jgi:thiamine pyrophosphate-dependent acetolactate synthase large subunit-like protein
MNHYISFVCCVLCAGVALAGEDAATRITQIEQELTALRQQTRTSPDVQRLQSTAKAAQEAYEVAEKETSGVAQLDIQMDKLRKELRALTKQRNEHLRANASVLDAKRQAWMDAEDVASKALRGGARGTELLRERTTLLRALDPRKEELPTTEPAATAPDVKE